MKIIFWIATIVTFIWNLYSIRGFINVYYKNYNGGPSSSSGSIIYVMITGIIIFVSGLIFYFTGHLKTATLIMAGPVALLISYMLLLLLPALFGGRMN
jgi:Na+/melibiose symporter-like transporter